MENFFLFLKKKYIFFCLHVCMWSVSEEIPDALDVGLSMVVSYDVGAGNTPQVFLNNRECSWSQSHLFISPKFVLYKVSGPKSPFVLTCCSSFYPQMLSVSGQSKSFLELLHWGRQQSAHSRRCLLLSTQLAWLFLCKPS